jgi:hypothetical protein
MVFPNFAGKHVHDALPRSSHLGLVSTEIMYEFESATLLLK